VWLFFSLDLTKDRGTNPSFYLTLILFINLFIFYVLSASNGYHFPLLLADLKVFSKLYQVVNLVYKVFFFVFYLYNFHRNCKDLRKFIE